MGEPGPRLPGMASHRSLHMLCQALGGDELKALVISGKSLSRSSSKLEAEKEELKVHSGTPHCAQSPALSCYEKIL